MKKEQILIASLLTITVSSVVYTNNTMKTINECKNEISELENSLEHNQNVLNGYQEENENLQNTISDLQEQLEKTSEELENARRDIAKYTAVTYFNSSNVTEKSNATIVHMRKALNGTELYDLSQAFVDAETQYGVNSYFIAAICAQESAWGTSYRAKYQNNLTGHAVYHRGAGGTYFSSKYESVMATAKMLKEDYLTETGQWFNGYSVIEVNQKYCFLNDQKTVDVDWSINIIQIAEQLKKTANKQ